MATPKEIIQSGCLEGNRPVFMGARRSYSAVEDDEDTIYCVCYEHEGDESGEWECPLLDAEGGQEYINSFLARFNIKPRQKGVSTCTPVPTPCLMSTCHVNMYPVALWISRGRSLSSSGPRPRGPPSTDLNKKLCLKILSFKKRILERVSFKKSIFKKVSFKKKYI